MRIAICEDNKDDAHRLCRMVSEYLKANRLEAGIDLYANGEDLLEGYSPGLYEIVFLDIYMAGITGMQVAEQIRETDRTVVIILTTVSKEFGIESYAVNAAYYLVKPVEREQLAQAMGRCRPQLARLAKYIEVTSNRETVRIHLRDILYVEAQLRACVFVTGRGQTRVNASLDQIGSELDADNFVRCHRSFIVNLDYVKEVRKKDFCLQNGFPVPIGKTYYPSSIEAFKEYFLKGTEEGFAR